MFDAYTWGQYEALMKLGAVDLGLTPTQLEQIRMGARLPFVLTPEQVTLVKGMRQKNIPRHPPISDVARNYMQRLTETGTPTQPQHPVLQKAQRDWRHFARTKIPELVTASGDYELPEKVRMAPHTLKKGPSGQAVTITDEGVARIQKQMKTLKPWIAQKGKQLMPPPSVQARAKATQAAGQNRGTVRIEAPQGTAHAGATANTVRTVASPRTGELADTMLHIAPSKPSRQGIGFAKTILHRLKPLIA